MRRVIWVFVGTFVAAAVFWGALRVIGSFRQLSSSAPSFLSPDKAFFIVAHRGGGGHRPENTQIAFEYAARLGTDVIPGA